MKILFFLIFGFLLLQACGKKSDPEYQGKINQKIIIII